MQTIDIEKTQQAWTNLNQILFIPRTESEEKPLRGSGENSGTFSLKIR